MTVPMLPDGTTDLPPGKIAAVATFLEMTELPAMDPAPVPADLSLQLIGGDLARYRALYRQVGEPWLWFSRAVMSDDQLHGVIADPAVEAWALTRCGRDIGLLELDFRTADACELVFFGLVPEATRQGLGRLMMDEAVRRAWSRPIRRLWLHTCTLDDPRAVAFYRRSGFTPYKRAVEVAEDPRLTGRMPRDAAPHWPVIG